MTRWFARTWFRIRMLRFRRAPVNPRASDGRFLSRKHWRLVQMGRDDLVERLQR
ncbi:hypothetical protein [Sphingopyxis sp. JAI128]|uniref:hypothetical protein n=1 Tax=Sphingopyxis sp. JAI128 TaxID=2723066 RepID=UPI00160C6164|nr:hypothetical protein [Sphingopyxis sp. JAI128]MBB6424973.1 hypothetical protein [Sphingopyxis sp. JAI128]